MAGTVAVFGNTIRGKNRIIYHGQGNSFEFVKQLERQGKQYWSCVGCKAAKRANGIQQTVPSISTENGIFLADPENPKSVHFCPPYTEQAAEAKQKIQVSFEEHLATKCH